jgi:uncharacterized protein (DUF169 family)
MKIAMLNEYKKYSEDIEKYMLLRTPPLAVKMLSRPDDIPREALRPRKDFGYHLAQCQAFSISRRKGTTIAMLTEDNWCWGPLFAYGLVDPAIASHYPELQNDMQYLPLLEYGKYTGIVSAPLKNANFDPDIVLIYSNVAQLRNMLWSLSHKGEGLIDSPLYPVASCAFAVVPALSGKYCVTLPDPGECGRALAGEDEIIFSFPANKLGVLASQLAYFEKIQLGYRQNMLWETRPDFPRPEFYKKLFRECGLDASDTLTWP